MSKENHSPYRGIATARDLEANFSELDFDDQEQSEDVVIEEISKLEPQETVAYIVDEMSEDSSITARGQSVINRTQSAWSDTYSDKIDPTDRQMDEDLDFIHQIAYRFEKCHRLQTANKSEESITAVNNTIRGMILGNSWVFRADPMTIYYCLYFSVFFNNSLVREIVLQRAHKIIASEWLD